jgi:hypothetical protein
MPLHTEAIVMIAVDAAADAEMIAVAAARAVHVRAEMIAADLAAAITIAQAQALVVVEILSAVAIADLVAMKCRRLRNQTSLAQKACSCQELKEHLLRCFQKKIEPLALRVRIEVLASQELHALKVLLVPSAVLVGQKVRANCV